MLEIGNTVARRFPGQASAWMGALLKFGLDEAGPERPGKALSCP